MLLRLAQLLVMKIRVGDGWTVVCSKKRQSKKNLNGKNSGKEKRSEKEGERESKDFKEANFQEDRSLRSGPKLSSFETTPVLNFCSGPKPVKFGNVVAGEFLNPSDFDDFDCWLVRCWIKLHSPWSHG